MQLITQLLVTQPIFSLLFDDDTVAPALQSGLDSETLKEKEKVIFDQAMNAMSDEYWRGLTCDGFAIETQPVHVNEDTLLYDDFDCVKACLKSPLRNMHEYKDINEFK
jgi:hypothetical protein